MTVQQTKCHGRECKGKKSTARYMPLIQTMIDNQMSVKKAAKHLQMDIKVANLHLQQAKQKSPELYQQVASFI